MAQVRQLAGSRNGHTRANLRPGDDCGHPPPSESGLGLRGGLLSRGPSPGPARAANLRGRQRSGVGGQIARRRPQCGDAVKPNGTPEMNGYMWKMAGVSGVEARAVYQPGWPSHPNQPGQPGAAREERQHNNVGKHSAGGALHRLVGVSKNTGSGVRATETSGIPGSIKPSFSLKTQCSQTH
eukprot:gene9393-biopygen1673